MRAVCNGVVIAESDDTVVVEGNHYFPASSVVADYLVDSTTQTSCPWKGVASYKTVTVNTTAVTDGAWYYPTPLPEAVEIKDRFAFWKGIVVEPSPAN